MIGSIVGFSGNFAFGGFGSTGLSGGGNAYAADAASRLLAGSSLSSLAGGRAGVAEIQAALTQLRDALIGARDNTDAVPGRTTLKAVTATIERYVDKPTYVTIDGKPVQNGTVTVSVGQQEVLVGYERVDRGRTDIGESLRVLLNATVNVGSAPGLSNENTFGSQIGAFLKSADLNTALSRPDKASLDGAINHIDGLLASAEGLGFAVSHRAAAAAQVDLGGLLLGAAPNLLGASPALTGSDGASAYQTAATSGTESGSTVSTVA